MVYSSVNEKGEVQGIVVSCDCGCSNIEFKTLGGDMFISAFGSDWYNYQGLGAIRENPRRIFNKIRHKNNFLHGLVLKTYEVRQLIELGRKIKFEDDDDDSTYTNDSHIILDYIDLDKEHPEFNQVELLIVCDSSLWDMLRNKTFRGYEICLKKHEWERLIDRMENYLNKKEEKAGVSSK